VTAPVRGHGSEDVGAVFFDLYGTLLPLGPLDDACDRLAPGRGREIAARWRTRQLEATWLRTIMDRWTDLDVITRDALGATLKELEIEAADAVVDEASGAFARLPIGPTAADAIRRLREAGHAVGILTNASQPTVNGIVARLGVAFDHVLSADAVRQFKPAPPIYELAVRATGLPPDRVGFVTANGWDAAGAGAFGLRVAWLAPAPSAVLPAVDAPPPMRLTWSDIPAAFG
jgi:2-haloacid dehalogenase